MPTGVYKRTEEYRKIMSEIMKGRRIFWKDKISESLRGHLVSPKTRIKLSDKFKVIAKEKGFGKWMKGKKYPKARNKKVSMSLKKVAGIEKASGEPNKKIVGKVTKVQLK